MQPKQQQIDSLRQMRSLMIALLCIVCCAGCHQPFINKDRQPITPVWDAPRELDKATLPAYRIEPPDILSIDVVQQVSESEYQLHAGDTVLLTVANTMPDEPIAGVFPVEAGGVIQLGFSYGQVDVSGCTAGQARAKIHAHLSTLLREPQVTLSLRGITGIQRISGEHMVGPDGTVTLGRYGSVPVVGLTLDEARSVISQFLAPHFSASEVSLSVFSYNSKVYYVVTQGGGLGDNLVRLPFTGNETVMDAISHINGLSQVSSTRMWVARPGRDECGDNQIMPIDWMAITQRGEVATNYQLLPGDRLYIAHDRMIAFDGALSKFTAPFERVFGFTLLGTTTASRLSGRVLHKTTANFPTDIR